MGFLTRVLDRLIARLKRAYVRLDEVQDAPSAGQDPSPDRARPVVRKSQ
jgi:hypothetical protein